MYEQTFSERVGYFVSSNWDIVWPEYILPIFIMAILLNLLYRSVRVMFKGKEAFAGATLWGSVFKIVATAATLFILMVIILTSVEYFGGEDVTQHRPLWKEQVQRFPAMVFGVFFGTDDEVAKTDSNVSTPTSSTGTDIKQSNQVAQPVDTPMAEKLFKNYTDDPRWWRYLLAIAYLVVVLAVVWWLMRSKKYKPGGVIALLGLAVATVFRSQFLPADWLAMSFGLWQLFLGGIIAGHWFWRHKSIDRTMSWNIDPEAGEGKRGPQKHWYGDWGNALFHLAWFMILGPLSSLFWQIKIRLFWEFLVVFVFYALIVWYIDRTTKNDRGKRTVNKVKNIYQSGFDRWKNVQPWIQLTSVVILLVLLISLFFIARWRIPIVVVIFSLLPFFYVLGGIYEPHIRGRLVLIWFKKPIFNRLAMLGAQYIDSGGLKPTLLPSWLWRVNIYLVDFAKWEIEQIKTEELPTLDPLNANKAGQTITVSGKATVQRYDPMRWLSMDEEDRDPDRIKEVIIRYVQAALGEVTRRITYDEAKVSNVYRHAVRRQDLDTLLEYANNLPEGEAKKAALEEYEMVKREYRENSRYLQIKVDDRGNCVKNDERGRFIPATFFEYLDWLLLTMTGCRLIQFDVLDVSGDQIVEDAEKQLRESQIKMEILRNMGIGQGDRRAAEISRVAAIIAENPQAALGAQALERLIGAENSSVLYKMFSGWGDKMSLG